MTLSTGLVGEASTGKIDAFAVWPAAHSIFCSFYSKITSTTLWKFYGYVYEVIVKAVPTFIIFTLNLMMLFKMRVTWNY